MDPVCLPYWYSYWSHFQNDSSMLFNAHRIFVVMTLSMLFYVTHSRAQA
jgi:uncharacterized membrane protein YccC